MATKSANVYARIEPDVKEQAEGILAALGIPASNAINMFYKQIILQRGLPFEVKMPSARPVGISALLEAQMNAELEKEYADMQSGHTRSAKSVFYAQFYGRRYRPWLTEPRNAPLATVNAPDYPTRCRWNNGSDSPARHNNSARRARPPYRKAPAGTIRPAGQ